jgi:nucleotide-binding universal stress UspA family protein
MTTQTTGTTGTPGTTGARPVVVGVDGTEDNVAAVRFAIDEARHTGSGVTLVHVVPTYLPVAPMLPMAAMDMTGTGQRLLGMAEKRFGELGPAVPVASELRCGNRAAELVAAAEGARLLVVGRDARPLVERLLMGDVTTGVAARADVPVTVVPGESEARERHGVVLVGLQSPADPEELLADAFDQAAHRGARLLVLHAWWLPSGYDDLVGTPTAVHEWEAVVKREMDEVLAPHRARHPGVAVATRVVHDHPGHALVEAAESADLVVISRRGHGLLPSVHLGGVARAVLRGSEAPVRVVPPPRHDEE